MTKAAKKIATPKSKTVGYSDGESKALDALKAEKDKRLTSAELIEKVYGAAPPFHARQAIVSTMKALAAKIERNREAYTLKKTERAGPVPVQFWLEERGTS